MAAGAGEWVSEQGWERAEECIVECDYGLETGAGESRMDKWAKGWGV